MTLPADVDTTRWEPEVDRKGRPIAPGDYVSVPTYPRGTVRGTLRLSEHRWTVLPGGVQVASLVVETASGARYEATSKVLKLKDAP